MPDCTTKTIESLRKKKLEHWDANRETSRAWLSLNMMTEARAGFQAFHRGSREQGREVDFIDLRRRLARGELGRRPDPGDIAAVPGWVVSGEHLRHHVSDDGAVHTLTMDKQPGNVIDIALCRELAAALPEAAGEPDAKVLVLRGAGKNFCFGASVEEHLPETAPAMLRAVGDVVRGLIRFPPTPPSPESRGAASGVASTWPCHAES